MIHFEQLREFDFLSEEYRQLFQRSLRRFFSSRCGLMACIRV